MTTLNIGIVNDLQICVTSLKKVLASVPQYTVVWVAGNGAEAVDKCRENTPDLVLMDLLMPEMDGIEAIRQIREQQPSMLFLVMTSYSGNDQIFPAIKAGAQGYLLKDSGAGELCRPSARFTGGNHHCILTLPVK